MKRNLSILSLIFITAIPSLLFLAAHQQQDNEPRDIVLKRTYPKMPPSFLMSSAKTVTINR